MYKYESICIYKYIYFKNKEFVFKLEHRLFAVTQRGISDG